MTLPAIKWLRFGVPVILASFFNHLPLSPLHSLHFFHFQTLTLFLNLILILPVLLSNPLNALTSTINFLEKIWAAFPGKISNSVNAAQFADSVLESPRPRLVLPRRMMRIGEEMTVAAKGQRFKICHGLICISRSRRVPTRVLLAWISQLGRGCLPGHVCGKICCFSLTCIWLVMKLKGDWNFLLNLECLCFFGLSLCEKWHPSFQIFCYFLWAQFPQQPNSGFLVLYSSPFGLFVRFWIDLFTFFCLSFVYSLSPNCIITTNWLEMWHNWYALPLLLQMNPSLSRHLLSYPAPAHST